MRFDAKTRLAGLAVLALIFVLGVVFWPRGDEGLWDAPTTPYASECIAATCVEVVAPNAGHGGDQTLQMVYDPNVDDDIAQWGDCLDSVLTCRRDSHDTLGCVQAATCPADCIATYEAAAADMPDEAGRVGLFLSQFVDDGGACVPTDGDGVTP